METKSLRQQDLIRKAIIKEFKKCQPSGITFQKQSYKPSLKVNQSNHQVSHSTMDDNQKPTTAKPLTHQRAKAIIDEVWSVFQE